MIEIDFWLIILMDSSPVNQVLTKTEFMNTNTFFVFKTYVTLFDKKLQF